MEDCIRNYNTCSCIRKAIDDAKHESVKLYQNLGTDSTKAERRAARAEEKRIFQAVRYLDKKYVDEILKHLD